MTKAEVLRISHDLALPLNAITQTFAFIARRGAGKTYAASKLAEQMLIAHMQIVVLDPVGNWYGLRLAADGSRSRRAPVWARRRPANPRAWEPCIFAPSQARARRGRPSRSTC